MPLLTDDDPLGVETFATHRLPLRRGAGTPTRCSRRSRTAWIKVVLQRQSATAKFIPVAGSPPPRWGDRGDRRAPYVGEPC